MELVNFDQIYYYYNNRLFAKSSLKNLVWPKITFLQKKITRIFYDFKGTGPDMKNCTSIDRIWNWIPFLKTVEVTQTSILCKNCLKEIIMWNIARKFGCAEPMCMSRSINAQKEARVDWCSKMLEKFIQGASNLFYIVTCNESWIYAYKSEIKRANRLFESFNSSRICIFENRSYDTVVRLLKNKIQVDIWPFVCQEFR